MSEPAIFVVIRNDEKRYFYDRWAHVFLYRNLVWGPDALDAWLAQEEESEIEEWDYEICGGAVIDHDRKRLVWDGDDESLALPRVNAVMLRLLSTAWPGYEISYAAGGINELAEAAGETLEEDYRNESDADLLSSRYKTVRGAAGLDDYDDDEEEEEDIDDDEEESCEEFVDDDVRAWVTLINEQGAVRHRHLHEVSQDLLSGEKQAIKELLDVTAADVPPEKVVLEGIWFDFGKKQIGWWGGSRAQLVLPILQSSWPKWDVQWASNGYADQCAVSGPSGIPMNDAEALAQLTPKILSTKRIDMSTILGVFGGAIKKTAIKAVGCLAIALAAPILLFGLIAGKLVASLITVAITWLAIVILYKIVETRFKRKFSDGMLGDMSRRDSDENARAPVAGPLDAGQRKSSLDSLLSAGGLPPLAEIQQHVSEDDDLEQIL